MPDVLCTETAGQIPITRIRRLVQMSMAQAEGLLAPVCTQSVRSVKQGGRTMRQVRTDRS